MGKYSRSRSRHDRNRKQQQHRHRRWEEDESPPSRYPARKSYREDNSGRHSNRPPPPMRSHRYPRQPQPYLRTRNKQRYRERTPTSPSHSSSSSSSSSASSSSGYSFSESVSSATRRRRTTPHYKFKIGEKLGHKYKVTRLLGTGTFGRVLECTYKGESYAIKVIKPVQKYIDSARIEKSIVKELNRADPDHRHHIIRYYENFYHYQHYCIVFETLGKSLYDLIKQNRYKGYPLAQVQAFSRQLFEAIGFMHSQGYTHTDLKPENILLSGTELREVSHPELNQYMIPASTRIKIIDFGGATHRRDKHSSVINTRQYRSPEVLLECCPWSEVSDVWSLGCIIPELLTGDLLFSTHQEVQHLAMINKQSGPIPPWMGQQCRNELKRAFKNGELDQDYIDRRCDHIEDVVGLKLVEQICQACPQLGDLLEKCLICDPAQRISCDQALRHPFFDLKL